VSSSSAVVLFEEDWDTGAVDPNKWHTDGTSTFIFDLGATGQGDTGDYAYWLRDASFSYTSGIRSKMQFNREQELICSFKLIMRPSAVIRYTGVCGPWVNTDTLPAGTLPALEQIEAGISRSENDGYIYYVEGTDQWSSAPALSDDFYNAILAATNKSNAVDVKVTLGTSTGAKFEWSSDGINYTTEFDTIGQTAGQNYAGGNLVSSSDPVWLYFAGSDGDPYDIIVDDIKVETAPCMYDLAGDVNSDCKVDIVDLAFIADIWLVDCELTPGDPACKPL
jgi:hypothetical protein